MLAVRSPFMQTKVCARKKLKQEPDRSTNQISEKKSISTGLKAPSRKERSKCGFQACLPVALSLETGGRGSLLAKVRTSAGKWTNLWILAAGVLGRFPFACPPHSPLVGGVVNLEGALLLFWGIYIIYVTSLCPSILFSALFYTMRGMPPVRILTGQPSLANNPANTGNAPSKRSFLILTASFVSSSWAATKRRLCPKAVTERFFPQITNILINGKFKV